MNAETACKFQHVAGDARQSAFRKYRDLTWGDCSFGKVILGEILITGLSGLGGALGLFLRKICYRWLFPGIGRGVVFGRNVTFRHPHKIRIGSQVVIDDNAVIDAKGSTNRGLVIGDRVYIGRNTIVYCKNGDITLEAGVNISSNCQVFSSNALTVGRDTVIGAFTYLLSGGEYDYTDRRPFAAQEGTVTKGPLTIGPNCWIGAGVTVLDAASVGAHCVLAAGAVVTRPVPPDSLVGGVPARVIKSIG